MFVFSEMTKCLEAELCVSVLDDLQTPTELRPVYSYIWGCYLATEQKFGNDVIDQRDSGQQETKNKKIIYRKALNEIKVFKAVRR